MKGMGIMFLVMIFGLVVAGAWDAIPAIKSTVHGLLDPSFGVLMNWNLDMGFILIISHRFSRIVKHRYHRIW